MNVKRLVLRAALLTTLAAALGLSAHGYRHAIDHAREASYRHDLRRLEALDARLDRELLRSRSGLVMHYDSLSQTFHELVSLRRDIASVPAVLGFDPGHALRASLSRIGSLLQEKQLLLESFKTENAVLRNSRQYYPVLLNELQTRGVLLEQAEPFGRRLSAVLGALAYFDVTGAREAVARLAVALDELERQGGAAAPPGMAGDVELALRHGRLIVERWPVVDQLVAKFLEVPLRREIAVANASYDESYRSSLYTGQRELVLLAALGTLAIVLGLAEVIAKLQSNGRALSQAKERLEEANRALERERQRERLQNELKTRFVSATSHEFRTPLATILSSSQLLAAYGERWDAERRGTHFQRITTAAHHMTQMLDEVLLIGRAEVGALVPLPTLLDLREVCQSLIDNLSASTAPGHAIHFSFRGQPRVRLDQRLFTHVLGNLLENAFKYSEPGSEVGLHVNVHGEGVHCVVQDSGIGIESGDLPHLFDSFYRGRNVGAVAGSGLGLAAAKRALDVQRGSIEVRSERGSGTEVTVWLPLGGPAPLEGSSGAPERGEAQGTALAEGLADKLSVSRVNA